MTIIVKDSLRQAIESASNGKQTILYTAKGQPCFMNIIEKFSMSKINPAWSGTHPAFIVNGVEKDVIYIGTYQGYLSGGELLSMPNVAPLVNVDNATLRAYALANGAGWHAMTNVEWAALALIGIAGDGLPHGNTQYGMDATYTAEKGRRVDGLAPGFATSGGTTYTGSGPVNWRHDRTYSGVTDLVGNIREGVFGVRMVGGEIQVIAGNNAALSTTDLSSTSAAWKAIDAASGELITPTFTGSIAAGNYVATTSRSVRYATSSTADYTLVRAFGFTFSGITNPGANPVAAAAIEVLKQHLLYPMTGVGGEVMRVTGAGENFLIRGGNLSDAATAGMFQMYFDNNAASFGGTRGGRVAYVTP